MQILKQKLFQEQNVAQIRIVRQIDVFESPPKTVDEVIDKQFIANFETDEEKKHFLNKIEELGTDGH